MTDIRALSLSECIDILESVEQPTVVMHIRPDGDTVGSAAALCRVLMRLGKRVKYACSDVVPKRLEFLLFDLEKAEENELFECVAVDVPSPVQLGELIAPSNVRLVIDHHVKNTPYAPHYTLPERSSAGEVIYEIACELERRGRLCMDSSLAEPLYAAISSDTGCFAFSNASSATYIAAARLIECGIDQARINRLLFASKSKEQLEAEGIVARSVSVCADGRISCAVLTKEDMSGFAPECFDTAVDIVRSVADIEVALLVKELSDGSLKISMRSNGKDVSEIAARFGGGGHKRAAACTLSGLSAEDGLSMLIKEIEKIL